MGRPGKEWLSGTARQRRNQTDLGSYHRDYGPADSVIAETQGNSTDHSG